LAVSPEGFLTAELKVARAEGEPEFFFLNQASEKKLRKSKFLCFSAG